METSALSQQLRELRTRSGLTQIAAAQELGIANTTLSQYESGKRVPGIKMLRSMSVLYDIPLDEFFSVRGKAKNFMLTSDEIARLCALKVRMPELLECLCRMESKLGDEKLTLVKNMVTALIE